VKKKNVWGLSVKDKKKVEKLKAGDHLIFYVKQRRENNEVIGPLIVGVYKIVSEPFRSEDKIFSSPSSDSFPLRVKIKAVAVPREALNFKTLVPELSFIRKKKNWGRYMQKSMGIIPEEDAATIISHLERNM